MVMMHVWYFRLTEHYGEFAGRSTVSSLFLLFLVFLFCRNSRKWFWGLILWHLWIGRARHPGPAPLPSHVGVEVLKCGWLAYPWGFILGG